MLPSLYDFKPLSPHRVEFKPLWADYLGSLDPNNVEYFEASEQYYTHIRQKLRDLPEGNESVISSAFLERVKRGPHGEDVNQTAGVGGDSSWEGVPYGKMVGGGSIPHKRYSSDENSGNIAGMTLAKAKITFKNSTLTLQTDQWLGLVNVTSAINSTQTVFGGLGIFFGAGTTGGVSTNRYGQWGRNDDTPWRNGFGTSALHARVCDQWPDEQTLFDPRYFAVMHFNPQGGVWREVDNGTPLPKCEVVNENEPNFNDAKAAANWERGDPFPPFKHQKDREYTTVDFRIPTYIEGDEVKGTPVGVGDPIDGDHYRGEGKVFLEAGHWRVETVRRGQLLPLRIPRE